MFFLPVVGRPFRICFLLRAVWKTSLPRCDVHTCRSLPHTSRRAHTGLVISLSGGNCGLALTGSQMVLCPPHQCLLPPSMGPFQARPQPRAVLLPSWAFCLESLLPILWGAQGRHMLDALRRMMMVCVYVLEIYCCIKNYPKHNSLRLHICMSS